MLYSDLWVGGIFDLITINYTSLSPSLSLGLSLSLSLSLSFSLSRERERESLLNKHVVCSLSLLRKGYIYLCDLCTVYWILRQCVCFCCRTHTKVNLRENADRTKALKETMGQTLVSKTETLAQTTVRKRHWPKPQ